MILVTTAGKVGTETATLLASQGRDVRVLVRGAGRHADLNTAGIELVTGDLDDAAAVQAALDGVDSVVLVSPPFRPRNWPSWPLRPMRTSSTS